MIETRNLHLPFFITLLIVILNPLISSGKGTNYITRQSGSWASNATWQGNIFPSYSGELSSDDTLFINHDVTLSGQSFLSGSQAKKFVIVIGKNSPVTLQIDKNFEIKNTIDIHIHQGSSFIVGTALTDYDYCDTTATDKVKFIVEGSEQDPSLNISNQARFILYGDMEVKNKFDIQVSPGGLFKVFGNFKAGNTATVSLTGAGAQVGCNMIFDNSAQIHMDVGTLNVGGNLLFGNQSELWLSGSTITVGGTICSYPGQGASATVYLEGTVDNPSQIISLHTCNDINLVEHDGVTLPIGLFSFNFETQENQVILEWITASETNNAYFTIERSRDMLSWEVIGTLAGAGNSNQQLSYQFADHLPLPGLSYYRLKQTDFDGKYEYFDPLAVDYQPEKDHPGFRVTKSPGQWKVHLPDMESWQVEVHALTGRILHRGESRDSFYFPAPEEPVVIRVYNNTHPPRSQVIM